MNPDTNHDSPVQGGYQKEGCWKIDEMVDMVDIVAAIRIIPGAIPSLILVVSPCRSGTTVLLRVFSSCGVQSHFQPLKNLLRWQVQGSPRRWLIPHMPNQPLLIKETLGPYMKAECTFNPLEVLLAAGFPPNKLRVLIVGREPLTTWASWYAYWKGKTSVENFVLTYQTTERVRHLALTCGIDTHCLVYEKFRENAPAKVFEKLFERLGLAFSPFAVDHWDQLPEFGASGSNIVLAEEPPIFVTPDIHIKVEQASRFSFNERPVIGTALDQKDVEAIAKAGLDTIYSRWKDAS